MCPPHFICLVGYEKVWRLNIEYLTRTIIIRSWLARMQYLFWFIYNLLFNCLKLRKNILIGQRFFWTNYKFVLILKKLYRRIITNVQHSNIVITKSADETTKTFVNNLLGLVQLEKKLKIKSKTFEVFGINIKWTSFFNKDLIKANIIF